MERNKMMFDGTFVTADKITTSVCCRILLRMITLHSGKAIRKLSTNNFNYRLTFFNVKSVNALSLSVHKELTWHVDVRL